VRSLTAGPDSDRDRRHLTTLARRADPYTKVGRRPLDGAFQRRYFRDMDRIRLRIAGAVLLSTLLLSFAEAAWAATCDPAMADLQPSSMGVMAEMPQSAHAAMAERKGMAAAQAGHECPPGSGHAHDPMGGDSNADCPFGPAGGLGCAVSASLPASATRVNAQAPVTALGHGAATILAYDLHAHAIFHPPKA
jgi:hypothetical protein